MRHEVTEVMLLIKCGAMLSTMVGAGLLYKPHFFDVSVAASIFI